METQKNVGISKLLPTVTIIVFALQPLLDVLSYWVQVRGSGNTLTLALRFLVLGAVAVIGFAVSKNKKYYIAAGLVCVGYFALHTAACMAVGYLDPVSDITNFIRVVQMPLFAFCFISFMRTNEKCYSALETGLTLNFWIITLVVGLGLVTGTTAPTYQVSGLGVLGWFATTNAQSSIMSLLAPIVVLLTYRKRIYPLFLLTSAVAFAELYLLGTRLAFLAIGITLAGLIIVMILTKDFSLPYAATAVALGLICLIFLKQSPMYLNQHQYTAEMSDKQTVASDMIEEAEHTILEHKEEKVISKEEREEAVAVIYEFYTKGLCQRFGTQKVMAKYDYSTTLTDITAVRPMKIKYCELLLDEHTFLSKLFGMELSRMTYDGFVYDVENDFHGVFFLYGYVGLGLMIAFLGYFIFIVIRCLIRDFRRYFTLEAGAFGMAFCLSLGYAYFTAGVLRRPNSSFYLSAVLAAVYYLIKLRRYENPPDGEEK